MSNSNKYTKQFIGSGKKHDTYDIVYTRLYVDKFESLLKTDPKGRKYLDLNVGSKREADQYGNTHGVWVNVLNEQPQYQQPQQTQYQQPQQVQSFNIDDAPF
jgi:hypothetical protein